MCVRGTYSCLFLVKSVSSEASLFVYSTFVDCLSPDSHWPPVNYFVNPHNSFNWCGFVYPGDQIELGEIVGGCQP